MVFLYSVTMESLECIPLAFPIRGTQVLRLKGTTGGGPHHGWTAIAFHTSEDLEAVCAHVNHWRPHHSTILLGSSLALFSSIYAPQDPRSQSSRPAHPAHLVPVRSLPEGSSCSLSLVGTVPGPWVPSRMRRVAFMSSRTPSSGTSSLRVPTAKRPGWTGTDRWTGPTAPDRACRGGRWPGGKRKPYKPSVQTGFRSARARAKNRIQITGLEGKRLFAPKQPGGLWVKSVL